MTLPEAIELFEFWDNCPPENEMLAMLAQAFTTWRPAKKQVMTHEDHQRSLEERWASGAMNAKQILEAFGGKAVSVNIEGVARPAAPVAFPGA